MFYVSDAMPLYDWQTKHNSFPLSVYIIITFSSIIMWEKKKINKILCWYLGQIYTGVLPCKVLINFIINY